MTTVPNSTQTPPAATANSGGIITDSNSLDQTFSNFLTLLTTQLQHQDPTAPMDTAQFTNQLVSFSQVEQQLKTNADLDKLVSGQSNSQASLALSYIGLNVSVSGNKFSFDPAKYANATLGYNLPSASVSTKISILDKDNNVVYSAAGSTKAGNATFSWNGNDSNGTPVPAGTYTIQVAATDANNKAITVATQVPGQVTGMQTADDGSAELMIGGQLVPLSSVISAYLPVTAAAN